MPSKDPAPPPTSPTRAAASEDVQRSFERQAELFSGPDAVFAWSVLSPLQWLEPLSPDWTALDLACGAAHVAEEIAPHVRQVVGVDLTAALLDIAATRLAGAGVANVLLQRGDAANLPFVDGSFDLVVCRAAMHHFPDPGAVLAEMARVCRAGGRVVVSDMVAAPGADRTAFDALHRVIDPSHRRCLTDAELLELVTRRVGPVVRRTQPGLTYTLAIGAILTDAGDPPSAVRLLEADLAGGQVTGFRPAHTEGGIAVTFDRAIMVARREGE
jgi:ubiquinone/menaquinone biosynthesis C-methylase UbiE